MRTKGVILWDSRDFFRFAEYWYDEKCDYMRKISATPETLKRATIMKQDVTRGAYKTFRLWLDGGAYMKDRFFYQIKEEAQRAIDAFPYWNEDLTHYPNANLEVL